MARGELFERRENDNRNQEPKRSRNQRSDYKVLQTAVGGCRRGFEQHGINSRCRGVCCRYIHYLWEHPDKYDPQRGKLKTWLSIVARTQAVNRCREISKRNTISLENTDFIDQLGVVDNILEAETRKSLIAAVNALGEPDREILIRRYYYDQKPKEIALAMDMSVKQVDNRLYQTS